MCCIFLKISIARIFSSKRLYDDSNCWAIFTLCSTYLTIIISYGFDILIYWLYWESA